MSSGTTICPFKKSTCLLAGCAAWNQFCDRPASTHDDNRLAAFNHAQQRGKLLPGFGDAIRFHGMMRFGFNPIRQV